MYAIRSYYDSITEFSAERISRIWNTQSRTSVTPGVRELSALHYLKNSDRFGLGGHDRAYFCHLRPDVSLQRTTVRSKIDGDAKLGRAIEICAELCQITNLWLDTPASVLCTPEELYRDIAAMGYDWEELLDTRGFWVYENDKHPQT